MAIVLENTASEPARGAINLPDGAEPLTLHWWHNRLIPGCDGKKPACAAGHCAKCGTSAWVKAISFTGSYDSNCPPGDIAPGHLAEPVNPRGSHPATKYSRAWEGDEHGHQLAIILGRRYGYFVIDVDKPDVYERLANLAKFATRANAMSTRADHFHVLVWVPPELRHLWPDRDFPGGECKGAGDGFVPVPGSWHYSGVKYEPAPGARCLVASEEMLLAIRIQPVTEEAKRAGYTGQKAGGRQGEILSGLMKLPRDMPCDEEEAWWRAEYDRLNPTKDHDIAVDPDLMFENHHEFRHGRLEKDAKRWEQQREWALAMTTQVCGASSIEAVEPGMSSQDEAMTPPPGNDEYTAEVTLPQQGRTIHASLIVGNPGEPMATARVLERLWQGGEGLPARRHWRGSFWEHHGTHWEEAHDREVRALMYQLLERAQYAVREEDQVTFLAWHPCRASIANVMEATEAVLHLPDRTEMGTWLQGDAGAGFVSCQNVLVNPVTLETRPHSAAFFNAHTLGFSYDPSAQCPEWGKFLASVFPGDSQSPRLLQEWFGYVLSGRTDLQKMLFMKGAMRSGKGTIARILTRLLGSSNVAGPTFDAFGESFGLEKLVTAQLAVIGDARSSADRRVMQQAISRLLSITGEDTLDINRKYKPMWSGKLPTRIMLMSNELPWFRDTSTAIVSRILLLTFNESFLGREDLDLENRLTAELPGIFNWALDGYRQLAARGRFTEPEASAGVLSDYRKQVSPLAAFLESRCQQGNFYDSGEFVHTMYAAYCANEGIQQVISRQAFLAKVQEIWPKVSRIERRQPDPRNPGERCRAWQGIWYAGDPEDAES